MKVGLFRAFPDPYRRSMEIYADRLLSEVRPLLREGDMIEDYLPVPVRTAPTWRRYWDQYVRYQRLAARARADVHHIVDPGYAHLVYSLPADRTIVTFHDAAVPLTPGVRRRTRLAFRYSLTGLRRARMVLTDSRAARQDLLGLVDYPEERIRVIPLGIDESFQVLPERDALRASLGLAGPTLLHVGHNQAYMNMEGIFRALDFLVREARLDARLIKVGDRFTPEQEALLGRLGLAARVTHLGRVPLGRLPDIYNSADVFLYPVLHAGFGLAALEAMACGVPVLASARGSLSEVLGDAPVSVDPEDPRLMAERLAALLTDQALRARCRARGLEQAGRYSWAETARQVLSVYRQVADA